MKKIIASLFITLANTTSYAQIEYVMLADAMHKQELKEAQDLSDQEKTLFNQTSYLQSIVKIKRALNAYAGLSIAKKDVNFIDLTHENLLRIDLKDGPKIENNTLYLKNIKLNITRNPQHLSLNISELNKSQAITIFSVFKDDKHTSDIIVNKIKANKNSLPIFFDHDNIIEINTL
jgi:hypothetical protein